MDQNCKNKQHFEITIAKLRKCLMKFSRNFECEVVQKSMAFIYMIFCMLSISYSYENLKKGKLMGPTKQDKHYLKEGYLAVPTRTCRAACYLHHPGAVHRVIGFIF